jgi:hypothetical protein
VIAKVADYPRWLALDREVTRTERSKFLLQLFEEQPPRICSSGRGFMTVRRGREAWQLGPCVADAEAGEALLNDAAARLAGEQVYFDTPDAHQAASRWAAANGLVARRHFVRMCRGNSIREDIDRLWASSGPELG